MIVLCSPWFISPAAPVFKYKIFGMWNVTVKLLPYEDKKKMTLRALALRQSERRRPTTWNLSFVTFLQ